MYTLKNNEILRDGVAVASIKDGELDFYEGMAKYRAPVVRFINSQENEPADNSEADLCSKLSEVIGMPVSKPHPKFGWRGTMMHDTLKLKRKIIVASDKLTSEEKKEILNKFI